MLDMLLNCLFIAFTMTLSMYASNKLPQILELPKDSIYVSSLYEPLSFQVKMSPFDSEFLLLIRYIKPSQPFYEFQTLFNSSNEFHLLSSPLMESVNIRCSRKIMKVFNTVLASFTITNWMHLVSQKLHIRVISSFGSILSSPMRIQTYRLEDFREQGDETVDFVMGNVGQIVCEIPVAIPSPPKIRFYYNSTLINVTNASRYKIVEFPPDYDRIALLIRNLKVEDSGVYKCSAYLPNTTLSVSSEKNTILIVNVPKKDIPVRFRLPSHVSLDNQNVINVSVPEGSKLVLYCIYESAPIMEVNWYWSRSDQQYDLDPHFGTLTISNISLRDNSDISCIVNEASGKIFRIHVFQIPRLISSPSTVTIGEQNFNKTVKIKCRPNIKNVTSKIHWFFNEMVVNNIEGLRVKGNTLVIKQLTWKSIGIYQCCMESKNLWLSDTSRVQLDQLKSEENPVVTNEVVSATSGLAVNLRCQIPIDFDSSSIKTMWYKEGLEKKKLSSNKQYLLFSDVDKNQQVLTILSIPKNIRNAVYICRIFSKERSALLVETRFKLLIKTAKPQEENDIPPKDFKQPSVTLKITKPEVSLPERFLLIVNVSWRLEVNLDITKISNIISHYRIEMKHGLSTHKLQRWRKTGPIIKWSNATMLEQSYIITNALIHGPDILKPQYWYSFRTMGIPSTKLLKLEKDLNPHFITNDFYQQIRSPWSDPVNFEHILPIRPQILNVTVLDSETAMVTWSYTPISEILRYSSRYSVEFRVLYKALQQKIHDDDLQAMAEKWYRIVYESGNGQLKLFTLEKILSTPFTLMNTAFSNLHRVNLTHLSSNLQYLVSVYAIHRPSIGAAQMYTSMSDPFLINPISYEQFTVTESVYPIPGNWTAPTKYFQNKILFLVLGSLAGILFVIALCMFIMCLWYQIRYHNRKRKNISSSSSIKTSSAHTFAPILNVNQIPNNAVFVASSNFLSPSYNSNIHKSGHFDQSSEFSHLYLAQHLSLWSPNHLAQFNLPNNLHDQIMNQVKEKESNASPTTLSTPSQKSNIEIEINNLDGSVEDSQEESVRLLDYQANSSGSRREAQCTLNNAFSVHSERLERNDQEEIPSDHGKSISHYPFSPSALDLYSQKKRSKFNSGNRKDFSNLKLNLKSCKLQNVNHFFPIRSRLSCFFPSAPNSDSPPPSSPIITSLCKDNSVNQYNKMKKDETFAEHPFLPASDIIQKRCLNDHMNNTFKYHSKYSPVIRPSVTRSKFFFDPTVDLIHQEDSQSNSTSVSARPFSYSMYPDGVRPCINLQIEKNPENNQTNL